MSYFTFIESHYLSTCEADFPTLSISLADDALYILCVAGAGFRTVGSVGWTLDYQLLFGPGTTDFEFDGLGEPEGAIWVALFRDDTPDNCSFGIIRERPLLDGPGPPISGWTFAGDTDDTLHVYLFATLLSQQGATPPTDIVTVGGADDELGPTFNQCHEVLLPCDLWSDYWTCLAYSNGPSGDVTGTASGASFAVDAECNPTGDPLPNEFSQLTSLTFRVYCDQEGGAQYGWGVITNSLTI